MIPDPSPGGTWPLVSALLLAPGLPTARLMYHTYGAAAGRRFALGLVGSLSLQQLLIAFALRRVRPVPVRGSAQALDGVDALTLTRGATAAILIGLLASGMRDRSGPAGWLGWSLLLPSYTLTDWVDGPLARRRGPSALGTVLDLEIDSWLTVSASLAAVGWGGLPRVALVPPLARYLLLLLAVRRGGYARFVGLGQSRWPRTTGIAQGALHIVALAPFRGHTLLVVTQRLAWVIAPLQLLSLVVLARSVWRTPMPDTSPEPPLGTPADPQSSRRTVVIGWVGVAVFIAFSWLLRRLLERSARDQ